jgi:uncharacterized protein DUF3866
VEHSLSKNTLFSPVLRRARVLAVSAELAEIELLEGPLAGVTVPGVFYRHLGSPPMVGEEVAANTVGLEMSLGTGGVAVIAPSLKESAHAPTNEDHFVKLPYTPLQFPASSPPQAENLSGVAVVVLSLHSHLAPACCAAATLRPECRVAFLWQEGGALPVALSRIVRELKDKQLLHAVVSAGSCFGGDLEAPNVYSGLLAAAGSELRADLVLAGVGPGLVGTATAFGHGGMAAAVALNAASSLDAEPVLAPRLSWADARERHRGLSHHTRTALQAALAGCRVAFPVDCEVSTAGLPERHAYELVEASAAGSQERFGLTFESMGRRYEEDPVFFDAAVAAVTLALDNGLPR